MSSTAAPQLIREKISSFSGEVLIRSFVEVDYRKQLYQCAINLRVNSLNTNSVSKSVIKRARTKVIASDCGNEGTGFCNGYFIYIHERYKLYVGPRAPQAATKTKK